MSTKGMYKVEENTQASEEAKHFYDRAIMFWDGAVNVGAGLRSIVRELDRNKDINANTDPGVRLMLAHIAYLLRLDGIGGVKDEDGDDVTEMCKKQCKRLSMDLRQ